MVKNHCSLKARVKDWTNMLERDPETQKVRLCKGSQVSWILVLNEKVTLKARDYQEWCGS